VQRGRDRARISRNRDMRFGGRRLLYLYLPDTLVVLLSINRISFSISQQRTRLSEDSFIIHNRRFSHLNRSYTMESSFCGCDQGALAGLHFDTEHLKAIGGDFCQALSMIEEGRDDWIIERYIKTQNTISTYHQHTYLLASLTERR